MAHHGGLILLLCVCVNTVGEVLVGWFPQSVEHDVMDRHELLCIPKWIIPWIQGGVTVPEQWDKKYNVTSAYTTTYKHLIRPTY